MKRLNDDPAVRLAECRGENAGSDLKIYGYQCRQSEQEKFFLHEYPHYFQHIPLVRKTDAVDLITRLKAENAALQQRLTIADQRVDDLESELTKARELFSDLVNSPDAVMVPLHLWRRVQDSARQSTPAANFIACKVDESCGQDAPAAKGDPDAS